MQDWITLSMLISFQNSWTALIIASKGGYTEVVQNLLEYTPNVNAVDKVSHFLEAK